MPRTTQKPTGITGCLLLVSLIIAGIWHFVYTAHRAAGIDSIRHELKARPEFAYVSLVIGEKKSSPTIKGKIATEAAFTSLTNLLSGIAADMPVSIWVEWPIERDPNREPGGAILTTVGRWSGSYERIGFYISSACFFCFAAFLFSLASTMFWCFWKRVCIEGKPWRDLLLLVLTPILSLAMIALLWWKQPYRKGSSGNQVFVFILLLIPSFLITVALFAFCLHSMVKRRYRLLSSLGILVSGLATLLEALVVTSVVVEPFLRGSAAFSE